MTLSDEDIEWIRKRLTEFYTPSFTVKDTEFQKRAIERRTRSMVTFIEEEKPLNIHEFVENQLKKERYDDRLKQLSNHITHSLLGDNKKCDKLSDEIDKLLDEADMSFPGFRKGRGLQISEMYQRIMAYRTKGAVGHQAEVRDIRKEMGRKQKK